MPAKKVPARYLLPLWKDGKIVGYVTASEEQYMNLKKQLDTLGLLGELLLRQVKEDTAA